MFNHMANQWPPPGDQPLTTPVPPPPPPPAYQRRPGVRESKAGYYTAAAIVLLGSVASIFMIVIGATNSGLTRIPTPVPASGNVVLTKTGSYVIYEISTDGASTSSNTIIITGPDGEAFPAGHMAVRGSVRSGGRVAKQVGGLNITTPGTYHIASANVTPPDALGVGSAASWGGLGLLAGGFSIGIVTAILGVGILIVTSVSHSRARRFGTY